LAKNKYSAKPDWCFDCEPPRYHRSRAEGDRAHQLVLMQKAGIIAELQHEPMWSLSQIPKITYKADFQYVTQTQEGQVVIVEDVKGILTRETRVKLAWLKEKHGVDVTLIRTGRQHER
jgi:hypothetical protein